MLSWTQDTLAIPQALPAPPKRKYSLLPILIVLFLVSYGLMCLLAVEQDRTISSQRWMIRSLLGDSSELSSLKGKLIQQQRANAQAQAKAGSGSQAQTPLTQGPLTQAPLTMDHLARPRRSALGWTIKVGNIPGQQQQSHKTTGWKCPQME